MPVKYTDLNIDPIMKDHYSSDVRLELAFNKRNIAISKLKKLTKPNDGGGGRRFIQPIDFARPGGVSADFATAQAGYLATRYEAFELPRARGYLVPQIDNETIRATKGNSDAFVKVMGETNKAFRSFGDWMEFRFFRDKGGTIGQMSTATSVAGAVATLVDRSDVYQYRKDLVVKLVSTASGGTQRTGTLTVASVNATLGQITFTANINTISGAANTDFFVEVANYDACALGLADWIPYDRSTLSTSFNGVVRSDNPERLAGNFLDGTSQPYNESLIDACAKIGEAGGMANTVFMHIAPFAGLMKLLEGKVLIDKVEEKVGPRIGFKGFNISFGDQELTVYPTRACPTKRIYVLDWDTWFQHSAGDCPDFLLNEVGANEIFYPAPTSDSAECRVGGYYNIGCSDPGSNCVISI